MAQFQLDKNIQQVMEKNEETSSFGTDVVVEGTNKVAAELLASRCSPGTSVDGSSTTTSESKEEWNITFEDISNNVGSTDEESHTTPDYVPGFFEGPEKTMEVWFRPGVGHPDGLRALSRAQLDHLCTKAKCSILNKISSNYIDAYVLSESSLFIYKHKYIMKTCGTTTLLRCLGSLLHFADQLGLELTWVGYSRKNLFFPNAQLWPHSSFGEEIKYLDSHEKLQDRLRGAGYILGPVTGDHWFVYVADHSELPTSLSVPISNEVTINLMMFGMAPEVSKIFHKDVCDTSREMTVRSGIANICPGATIDDFAFSPCGYSMNAILHDTYSTIHVTPEPACSYASYETNAYLKNYMPLVRNVLNVFKPSRFVLTMFGDESVLNNPGLPTESRVIGNPGSGQYVRTSLSSTKVESDLCCMMAGYSLDASASVSPMRKQRSFSNLA